MLYVQDTNKFPFPMTMEIIVNVSILENFFFFNKNCPSNYYPEIPGKSVSILVYIKNIHEISQYIPPQCMKYHNIYHPNV